MSRYVERESDSGDKRDCERSICLRDCDLCVYVCVYILCPPRPLHPGLPRPAIAMTNSVRGLPVNRRSPSPFGLPSENCQGTRPVRRSASADPSHRSAVQPACGFSYRPQPIRRRSAWAAFQHRLHLQPGAAGRLRGNYRKRVR